MIESLEKVLNSIIIPKYDRLVGVEIGQMGMGEIYKITYFINDRIDYHDGYLIESDTRSLFNMLAPSKGEDFIINYKMVDD